MKSRKYYFRIRDKIVLCILALLVPVILVMDVGVYTTYRDDLETQIVQRAEEANTYKAINLRTSLKNLEENILYKIMSCDLFGYQESLKDASVYSIERKMVNFSALLESMKLSVQSVYILDKWNCTFFCDDMNLSHEGYQAYKEREVFQYIQEQLPKLQEQLGKTIWRSFSDTSDRVFMIKNVLDLDTLEYRGILCVEIGAEYFAEKVDNETHETVLYDETGTLLYAEASMREDALAYGGGNDIARKYLITSGKVPVKKWTIVNFISRDSVLAKMRDFLRNLVILELSFLAVAIVLAVYLSGTITYNISSLIESFRRINYGETPEEVVYRSHDETAYLCEKFNDMNRELRNSIEQMTLNSVQREKAEYNALMAQMNPHFLYNTLESISAMAKLQRQPQIVESITKLSRLLRASITMEAQEISLGEELDYVEKYLELQKIITGGRINWELIRENDTETCLVPKLFLQPLVENSVIHGVGDMIEDAMIVIVARKQGNCLFVEVCDNGKGIREEQIKILLSEETDEQEKDRAHIGIKSIQKRIWILYGKEYGISISSSKEGTVVSVRLPVRKKEGETK